jgi:hypothetical protein
LRPEQIISSKYACRYVSHNTYFCSGGTPAVGCTSKVQGKKLYLTIYKYSCTVRKEKKIFLIYKEIQKSYMTRLPNI